MRIIMLGPPGSGKGTQGELIEKRYEFPRISTGDLLRLAGSERTDLGKKAEAQMKRGGLVEDEIVLEIVKERILNDDCRLGYVLDGFPRTISQAQKLEEMDGNRQEIVIEIHLPEEIIVERLSARRICPQCAAVYSILATKPKREGICDVCGSRLFQREDDKPEVIKERLRVYRQQTEPLIGYYQKKGSLQRVDGSGEIEAVFQNISSLLETEMTKFKEQEARK
jgi:adenylate kinase